MRIFFSLQYNQLIVQFSLGLIDANSDDFRIIISTVASIQQLKRSLMWRLAVRYLFSVQRFDPKKDYYKILSLNESATSDQIKKSFRSLAKKYHPDSKTGKQDMFKEINEANQVLSTEDIRKQYDQSRKANRNNTHREQHPRPHHQKSYQQRQTYESQHKRPQYDYDQQNPDKFRQYMRKKHEQQMKKYTKQRQNYDSFGKSYETYDKFRQQALKKKKQPFQQKVKITQQSVRKQQEVFRKHSQQKEQEYRDKMRHDIKADLVSRYNRAISNGQKTIAGLKQMGGILKDLFKKK